MISKIRSVQILVDLLKQFDIHDIVLSPGGSDVPLIHSIETDAWFTCYSVVDERSAAYFALGVSQQKNKVVACVCTSGTAVCNYLPGITEAYYQNTPVLAITADKNPCYQGQLETQKIDQSKMFEGVVKKAVDLPIINSMDDEWLCNRLVNEALLELDHHGKGPVHINIPIVGRTDIYSNDPIPYERRIRIVDHRSSPEMWKNMAYKLVSSKRVLVVVGQDIIFDDGCRQALDNFFIHCNCVFSIEHLSNLICDGCIHTYPISEMNAANALPRLLPELVISFGNNLSAYCLKPFLRDHFMSIENWLVNESGIVRDAYKSLTTIFEATIPEFVNNMLRLLPQNHQNSHTYLDSWRAEKMKIQVPELPFSNLYIASKLSLVIPENSVLHLAILNSTRIMQFFNLSANVRTYSNVGALGIDGCYSTFAGQAAATDQLAYLVIGDLSFFYDMNAAGLRSIGSNVRVILINNCGGSEFHFFLGKDKIPTINDYICAGHKNFAAGWIISLGYDYFFASTMEEFDQVIGKFGEKSDKPMFLEIITDMEMDAKHTREFYSTNSETIEVSLARKVIRGLISEKRIEKVKKIIKAIKE